MLGFLCHPTCLDPLPAHDCFLPSFLACLLVPSLACVLAQIGRDVKRAEAHRKAVQLLDMVARSGQCFWVAVPAPLENMLGRRPLTRLSHELAFGLEEWEKKALRCDEVAASRVLGAAWAEAAHASAAKAAAIVGVRPGDTAVVLVDARGQAPRSTLAPFNVAATTSARHSAHSLLVGPDPFAPPPLPAAAAAAASKQRSQPRKTPQGSALASAVRRMSLQPTQRRAEAVVSGPTLSCRLVVPDQSIPGRSVLEVCLPYHTAADATATATAAALAAATGSAAKAAVAEAAVATASAKASAAPVAVAATLPRARLPSFPSPGLQSTSPPFPRGHRANWSATTAAAAAPPAAASPFEWTDVEAAAEVQMSGAPTVARSHARIRHVTAQSFFQLGILYMIGEGVKFDLKRAVSALHVAAALGMGRAQNALANMYAAGDGVDRSLHDAARLYSLAADQGVVSAQYNFGVLLSQGAGVPRDDEAALLHWLAAADSGHVDAHYNVGVFFEQGRGVARPDALTAIAHYTLAAIKGHRDAMFNLAFLFEVGVPGQLTASQTLAEHYYLRAIDAGDAEALERYTAMRKAQHEQARLDLKESAPQGHGFFDWGLELPQPAVA